MEDRRTNYDNESSLKLQWSVVNLCNTIFQDAWKIEIPNKIYPSVLNQKFTQGM